LALRADPVLEASFLDGARAIIETTGPSVETSNIAGQPEDVLGQRVEENGAALITMGAYGHSKIRSFVLGSTKSDMLRSCRAPVVLMR